jgi:hypothetical protein
VLILIAIMGAVVLASPMRRRFAEPEPAERETQTPVAAGTRRSH